MATVDEPLRDDLKGLLQGELLFDDISRELYSTDASIFQVRPLGIVVPSSEEDVRALVHYAAEHRIPLIPRGAGSGVAGEALGSGLVVDLSRHLRQILHIGTDTVRVQPGVIHRELNAQLAQVGRRFAPDPASGAQCTIGGMLATNASGARALRHGYTRDHVASLRVVLDNGELANVGQELRRPTEPTAERLQVIVHDVAALLDRHDKIIRSSQPRTPFNRCGYRLDGLLTADHLDLSRLLVGSEGTLAVFTEATLRTIPLPVGRSVVLLGFANLDQALKAAQRSLPSGPSACDLIEHRLLTLARESDPETAARIPAGAGAVLLIEYESDTLHGAAAAAADLADQLTRGDRLALHAQVATEPGMIDRLWNLRETVLPSLYALKGRSHPIALIEDVGVPVEELPNYLRRVQDVLQKYETTASFLIHAGTGQVHTRPFLDLQKPDDIAKLWPIADEVHNLALDLGGTVSTQHGTGLARTPWVARQYGRLYSVMRELKGIFDPLQILNPGKIIGPSPEMPAWPLRRGVVLTEPSAAVSPKASGGAINATQPSTLLQWRQGEMANEAINCNGCGQCRTEAPAERMCPIFRVTHDEAATPRAKANLLRHLLETTDDARALSADAVREVADLCVNCKMCARECPARVNVPKLMLEAKAANVAEHGMTRSDWMRARMEGFASLGSALSFMVNLALGSQVTRWFLEKLFCVARQRRLPTFARQSFLQRAARRGWTRPPRSSRPRVVYFVDVYANYCDPQVAEATVAVLRHNGFDVYVPPGQVGCGMAPLAVGDIESAREAAEINLRVLAEFAREGCPIVCSEPTAAVMLRHDYRDLLDNVDTRMVSEQVIELTEFLGNLQRQGKLRGDFRRLDLPLGHHVPCHVKALTAAPAAPTLLSSIPGVRVHTIDVGCSGMAGTFGLAAENEAISREAGRSMLAELARPRVLFGSTECSACRMQMEDGSGKRTLHPIQYLALAYGLMPEMADRLLVPFRERVL